MRSLPLVAALAVGIPSGASGQQPSPNEGIMLDPFPVVGTRLTAPVESAPPPNVIVLDQVFLQRSGASDLAGLVGLLPQTYGGSASGLGTVPNGSPTYGTATAFFNFSTGAGAPLRQTGVSSAGLGAFGAGGTLVLVDGRRLPVATQEDTASETGAGFYDLSSIPLGLVERIEILNNGASAVHGSDAVGGVINVILRRQFSGVELTTGLRATADGGAFERHASLSAGMTRDRFNVFFSATGRSQNALKASQRSFSALQDLTALGGNDHRLLYGSPGVISARSGNLNGVTDANGNPVRFALVPTNQNGDGLARSNFTGAGGFSAARLRTFDSAAYKDLVGSLEQLGLRLSATYTISEHLEVFASVNHSDRTAETANEPPVIAGGGFGGAQTVIPAANSRNPFGQDVFFSGVLVEAPPRSQTVEVNLTTITTGVRGTFGTDWEWELAGHSAREDFDSRTLDLNRDALITALADGSFNAFGDPATHGPLNARLNNRLMKTASIVGHSGLFSLDVFVRGPVFSLPGGSALLAGGAETQRATRDRVSTDPLFGQPAQIASARHHSAAFAELYAPLWGEDRNLPLLQRLSARAAIRTERTAVFSQTSPSFGLQWQPIRALTVFAHYAAGFRAPSLTELEDVTTTGTIMVSDPLRQGARYAIDRHRGGNTDLDAETSRTYQAGFSWLPSVLPGLRFHAQLGETYWFNKINTLPEQVLINHESRFSSRVHRDAAGLITMVDATTINFGKVYNRAADFGLSYAWESTEAGRVTADVRAVRQLEYRVEDRPDRSGSVTDDGVDTVSPPQWSGLATLSWTKGSWDATILVRHVDGYASNSSGPFFDVATSAPSWTSVDFRVGLTFAQGIWRGHGRNSRLQLGVGNLANRQPPFANTSYGYNQSLHSALGRTYDVSIRMPW